MMSRGPGQPKSFYDSVKTNQSKPLKFGGTEETVFPVSGLSKAVSDPKQSKYSNSAFSFSVILFWGYLLEYLLFPLPAPYIFWQEMGQRSLRDVDSGCKDQSRKGNVGVKTKSPGPCMAQTIAGSEWNNPAVICSQGSHPCGLYATPHWHHATHPARHSSFIGTLSVTGLNSLTLGFSG